MFCLTYCICLRIAFLWIPVIIAYTGHSLKLSFPAPPYLPSSVLSFIVAILGPLGGLFVLSLGVPCDHLLPPREHCALFTHFFVHVHHILKKRKIIFIIIIIFCDEPEHNDLLVGNFDQKRNVLVLAHIA